MRLRIFACLFVLALTASTALAQKKSPINGRWEAKVAGQTYRFTFAEDQGDIEGAATLPNGKTIDIRYGFIFGNEFEFTTEEGEDVFEWTGDVSSSSIKGERLNLEDDSTVKFSGKKTK